MKPLPAHAEYSVAGPGIFSGEDLSCVETPEPCMLDPAFLRHFDIGRAHVAAWSCEQRRLTIENAIQHIRDWTRDVVLPRLREQRAEEEANPPPRHRHPSPFDVNADYIAPGGYPNHMWGE